VARIRIDEWQLGRWNQTLLLGMQRGPGFGRVLILCLQPGVHHYRAFVRKAATAGVDLVIGFAIGSLISGVAARSIRRRPVGRDYAPTRPDSRSGIDPRA
jgi:hypothetical protein